MSSQISITANGLEFAALADGPADGPLALLLHGFPDSAHTWRHLLPELAAAGFHAVAPWLRGYAPTAVPADADYGVGALVADVVALHDALGGDERAIVVGHDWGAIAAYGAAAFAPERWRRVAIETVPPLGSIGPKLFAYEQLRRSWYMYVFQTPIAETAVALDEMAFIDRLWRDWSPSYDASADLTAAKEALHDPANLTAAIGYYRALLGGAATDPGYSEEAAAATGVAPQPTLFFHGDHDGAAVEDELYTDAAAFMSPGSTAQVVPGTGHFPHLEEPTLANQLILDWVTEGRETI